MSDFWHKLPKPILVLAPMADVTDPAFRRIIAKYGRPDVTWTEFVSADGLFMGNGAGYAALVKDLAFSEEERPIVAQFFTSRPENMERAAALAKELGFDGIDINMGCPDRSIEKQGCGAAMMKDPALAKEIIRAAKRGAGDLPVSVKTRLGFNKDELEEWLPALLEERPAAITIHARTRKDMSKVPARWERIARAAEIRNEWSDAQGIPENERTLILGNGDVIDIADARAKVAAARCDGAMIGRAIFGNPWLFSRETGFSPFYQASEGESLTNEQIKERLSVALEHAKLFAELLPHKNISIMKKHFKAYVAGWHGAKELRVRLMESKDVSEMEQIITEYVKER